MGILQPSRVMCSENGKEEYVQAVKISGTDNFLLTVLEGNEANYELTLTNGTECFQGTVSPEQVALKAKLSRSKVSELESLTFKALTGHTEQGEEFVYSLTTRGNESASRIFAWKQQLAEGAARVVGEAVLHRRDYTDSIIQILTATMRIIRHREMCLQNSRSELERLRAENREALALLDRSVHVKEQMEQELYSKFVTVLNAKKRRIAQLQGEDEVRPKSPRVIADADEDAVSSQTPRVKSAMDILEDLV